MDIRKRSQYNHGVGKYKLLSSTAGVGSIITTKLGYFVMPKSVSEWPFLKRVNTYIKENPEDGKNYLKISKQSGVEIVEDIRFVEFLKNEEKISNLKCLVAVPHVSLNENNYPNIEYHPINIEYKERMGSPLQPEHFLIPAIHFPCWFYSRKGGYLRNIEDWKSLWKRNCGDSKLEYFAPPRDANDKNGRIFKDKKHKIDEYTPLVQVPMVFLCENGHISDIPWYKLFCALLKKVNLSNEEGFDLFGYECEDCSQGGKHEIQWIENRNQSESWGILKCKKCGEYASLEGIMNIKPYCNGETPWNGVGTKDSYCIKNSTHTRSIMRFALVTSNSVYYADSFSSLYIPLHLLSNAPLTGNAEKVLELLQTKWYPKELEKNADLTPEKYVKTLDIIYKADDSDYLISDEEATLIKERFIKKKESICNPYEQYRFEEYCVFSSMSRSPKNEENLIFNDINLPNSIKKFFSKIQQVASLSVTSTQLSFSRVKMPELQKDIDGKISKKKGQTIFSSNPDEVFALPANQVFGEGLFFELNADEIEVWYNSNETTFKSRYGNIQPGELGQSLYNEMQQYGFAKFYLLHTFSHILMRELEFSCGYPTASLKERLYFSDRMNGVLIYTAEGSEGSMGGLVWQGQPQLIENIIFQAMERAKNCSSDPLCWESDPQMNLAACFSCCLVSETSCEQRNLGLDRQILVNEYFGFFRNLN